MAESAAHATPWREHAVDDPVKKVLASTSLSGSGVLRDLLVYLAEHTARHPGQPAKESEIAAELFGRRGFDAREDSTVRVQTGRLRSKLAEYYLEEGAKDEVLIQIPKGSYQLVYRERAHAEVPAAPREEAPKVAVAAKSRAAHRLLFLSGWIVAALAVTVATALWLHFGVAAPPAERDFWAPFVRSDADTLVIFSNPKMAGDANSGLEYYRDGTQKPLNEVYTGTGTLMAVHQLTRLFGFFRKPLRIKRAQLLTWDESRNRNLIFVGSSESNAAVAELGPLHEFNFKPQDLQPGAAKEHGIVNEHPRPGEKPYYSAPATSPYRSDYAIIALLPRPDPSNRCLLLAGTNTYGTQAAAEFVTSEAGLAELLSRVGAGARRRVPFFEALLAVTVSDGVPVQSKLLLVRIQK